MTAIEKPFVSIVMPALNEEQHIGAAISSILPRSASLEYELLVVDGGSTDATLAIVRGLARDNERIRLVVNDKRIQSAAVNMAAREADPSSRILVRADCHSTYPDDFVERCIETLRTRQAASVVVPMRTCGRTALQKAIAAAQNSRLGNGGAAHRLAGRSGYVEHGHHAAFDRTTFLELGGYDETFTHNEDAEFDRRLIDGGHRIYLDGRAVIDYYPRAGLAALARQYFAFGRGRASTLLKHGVWPRPRQVLPVLMFLVCLLAALSSPYDARALVFPAVYLAGCIVWGVQLAWREHSACLALSGIAAVVMHHSWAAGFLARLLSALPRGCRLTNGRHASGR